ncbi:MAG TPA: ethanolamine ammonia-lyase light chain EutC, partial [Mucilaginibacter sp.]|nr:ethanolamine ammonia-lyase light chain EutC [Mucilaginibacter sp.]
MDQLEHAADEQFDPLKEFTAARIGLGRTGASIPVRQSLAFNLAHAHARDAVYSELDRDKLHEELNQFGLPMLQLHSKAAYREQYLQRPDLGRQLDDESAEQLTDFQKNQDMVIVIADG